MKHLQKGFTLIELLIVIAVIGVLATVVLAAIDPLDRIRAANDSKVQSDIASIASASEAYAVTHDGYYPATMAQLVASGDLKATMVPPTATGYGGAYTFTNIPAGCTGGTTCTGIAWHGPNLSKKYGAAQIRRIYDSANGKTCNRTVADVTCL